MTQKILLTIAGVVWAVSLRAAPAVDAAPAEPDTAAILRADVGALRPPLIHFGPPFDLPAELTTKVAAVRERLVRYTQTHAGEELGLDWRIAVEQGFLHSSITEWNRYPVAEAALRQWWVILAAARPADEHGVANLALRMAGYHLQNWSKVQPQACLAILTEAETRYWAASSAGEQADWKWWVARFAEMLQGAAGRVPEGERAEFLAAVGRLVNQSVTDETLPLHTRTFTITNQARQLYSQGQPEAAAALLDAWWAKYGEQIRTPDFYAVRFYVAYLGQGDRATATRLVERAGRLAAADTVFAKDGNYTGMMDAYYARLAWTEDELKRQAQLFVAARRRLAARDGGQAQ